MNIATLSTQHTMNNTYTVAPQTLGSISNAYVDPNPQTSSPSAPRVQGSNYVPPPGILDKSIVVSNPPSTLPAPPQYFQPQQQQQPPAESQLLRLSIQDVFTKLKENQSLINAILFMYLYISLPNYISLYLFLYYLFLFYFISIFSLAPLFFSLSSFLFSLSASFPSFSAVVECSAMFFVRTSDCHYLILRDIHAVHEPIPSNTTDPLSTTTPVA